MVTLEREVMQHHFKTYLFRTIYRIVQVKLTEKFHHIMENK